MAVRRQEHDDERAENDTQITLQISPRLQKRIQRAVAGSDQSVQEYLENVLERTIPSETDSTNGQQGIITSETIHQIDQLREQILQDRQGKLFEDSTETIRSMREERARQLENLSED